MAQNIGLLGGSFNPPHLAHIALAQAALQQLSLDRVDFMPAGQPWQKAGLIMALPAHRLAMCQLAVQGNAGLGVEPFEVQQQGLTYTVETLGSLKANNPHAHYTFIMGADQANRLDTWREWQRILGLCTLAIAARAGQMVQLPEAVQRYLNAQNMHVQRIEMPAMRISASAIRQALAKQVDASAMLPQQVAGYIAKHKLYTEHNN